MQPKISAFFKPRDGKGSLIQLSKAAPKQCGSVRPVNSDTISTKSLNKKRSYDQLHLELGQSDFLLRTCYVCGFKYACGDEGDEKVHKEFHKDYTHGIPFKGWNSERVVCLSENERGRVVLVLDGDPPAHKKKVKKVVEMMETDFGSGWLVHKLCKVYLHIMQKRVVGCLIAEPIKTAHRVLTRADSLKSSYITNANTNTFSSSMLEFGSINFQRETLKNAPFENNSKASEKEHMRAMLVEEEAVDSICGIRAIWVVPSMRRNQIATQLLDVARTSFREGIKLQKYQLAFSNPTSSGNGLACRYFGTASFLAYKTE